MEFGDRYKRNTAIIIEGDNQSETMLLNQKTNEAIIVMDTIDLPIESTEMKRINTVEKIDTTHSERRLDSIICTSIENDNNLEKLILQNYSTHPTPNSDNESSVSDDVIKKANIYRQQTQTIWDTDQVINLENEMKEQLRSLSQQTTDSLQTEIIKKSNVYRQNSPNIWDAQQVEQHENEMKEELLNLGKQINDLDMDQLASSLSHISQEILISPKQNELIVPTNDKVLESISTDDDEELPESNLYRDESQRKWNNPLIDKQKDEMTKQLIHLAKQHKKESSQNKSNDEFVYI